MTEKAEADIHMSATVLKGGDLLAPEGLKRAWGLRLESGLITQVAPERDLRIEPGDEVVDTTGQIVMPGFVNGHNHMYGFLSHGIHAEALVTEFSSFLEDFWWPYVEDRVDQDLVRLTTAWACVEMIDSGVTSFVDILEAPRALPGALEVEAEVVRAAGLRGILSFEACQRVSRENGDLGLEENAAFIRRHQGDAQIGGLMCVHTLFTCDADFLQKAGALAEELSVSFHMHLSESVYEPEWALKHLDQRPVKVYERLGLLKNNVLASQVVQVTDEELDILAAKKVRAVSMPLSNCEVGGGIAPLPAMLKRGLKVGLGTDGYLNNFFEVMRGAFLIHKAALQDPQAMPAREVFRLATDLGAEAAGFKRTGRLEKGWSADIQTVSDDTPTPITEHNVYDQIILFRNPGDVKNVWSGGRRLKRDGEIVTLDRDKAKTEMRKAAQGFWKSEASHAAIG